MTNAEARGILDRLWGKAAKGVPGDWHPVLLHMLDVAAVATVLLESGLGGSLAGLLRAPGISDAWLARIVAAHDLGKISPGFQAKVPARFGLLANAGLGPIGSAETDHGQVTQFFFPDLLESAGLPDAFIDRAVGAVAAHHGWFKSNKTIIYGGPRWKALAAAGWEVLGEAVGATNIPRVSGDPGDAWQVALAGLTCVADWVGSNPDWFPYAPGVTADTRYFEASRDRARLALHDLRWQRGRVPSEPWCFEELFPGCAPTALQKAVEAIAAGGPGLLLVEAPTGVGKTEAALMAVERWSVQGASGVYYGLPTQATGNQMVKRLETWLNRRYVGTTVDFHLMHGLAALNTDYERLKLRSVYNADGKASVASAWFRAKKRALLAPFGVGTVDQAMLAALRTKHFFVRLFGLAGKTVVIDEVHAYDTFMSRILDRLLPWLRVLGCPVVLLSATLSAERRRTLFQAWGQGIPPEAAYPRISFAGARGVEAHTVMGGKRTTVALLEAPATPEAVAAWLLAELAEGGTAAWICNTVGAAQAAFRALAGAGVPAAEKLLFHARFPVDDRLIRERRVMDVLGMEGDRPRRLIVVATQVIEQSLDIDVDLMVSELAPIDLLLQRAGRLQRHARRDRPAAHRVPRLAWIPPEEGPNFGASAWVYDEHVLLRSWLALKGMSQWTVPDELDTLIEAVYDARPCPPEAEAWRERWEKTRGELERDQQKAWWKGGAALVPKPDDRDGLRYGAENPLAVDPEDEPGRAGLPAKTRDIEASVAIVCLATGERGTQVGPHDPTPVDLAAEPWPDLTRRLAGRVVSLTQPKWVHRILAAVRVPAAWEANATLQNWRPVVFDQGCATIDGHRLRLDPELGLLLNENEEG